MYDHVCIELKKSKQHPPPPQKKNKKTKKTNKQKTTTTTDICIRITSKLSSLMPSLDETHRGVKIVVNTLLKLSLASEIQLMLVKYALHDKKKYASKNALESLLQTS